MEYIYAGMLLHALDKKIDETSIKKVLEAAGAKADESRIKALVAALDQVDINEAIEKAAFAPAATAVPAAATTATEGAKEENKPTKEDTKKKEEEASAGLGALF
ncbi:MAG: 50S ribosomal protein P1 [Candidatus Aenigmarchaeota archaeon]|nr:50S ribosomal protein P1 [Candidatus Aenigmarchaeota archaeon]MCK5321717.1 50S ribosomal protein P1 [Candidatus Aenigmarchaeota archaeon]